LLFPLFATNQQKKLDSRKCKVASESTATTRKNSLGAGWLYLACTLSPSPTEGFYVKKKKYIHVE
jgi:hypothetical protein